jgi:hypothetical protein
LAKVKVRKNKKTEPLFPACGWESLFRFSESSIFPIYNLDIILIFCKSYYIEEERMKNKKIWLIILALVLTFGIMIAGCGGIDDLYNNGDGDDPINVDLSLPSIQSVAQFAGVFPSNEQEQIELVALAFEEIEGLYASLENGLGGISMLNRQFVSPSKSRAAQREVYTYGPEEFLFEDETIMPGVVVSGFFRISGTTDDDYSENTVKAKLSIDFDDYGEDPTINGKYGVDETIYMKMDYSSDEPSMIIDMDASGGYALSVSKDGKGIKFVMEMTMKINLSADFDDFDPGTFILTLKIYDNDNNERFNETFYSLDDVADRLGIDPMGGSDNDFYY